jgi:hypothetical protein
MREREQREHAEQTGDPAPHDHDATAAPVRDEARGQHQERTGEVAHAEHEPDLTGVSAERLQVQRLERPDEAEAEAPEQLQDNEEPDVAWEVQLGTHRVAFAEQLLDLGASPVGDRIMEEVTHRLEDRTRVRGPTPAQ